MFPHLGRLVFALLAVALLLPLAGAPGSAANGVHEVDDELYELAAARRTIVHSWAVNPERNQVTIYTDTPDQARASLAAAGIDLTRLVFSAPRHARRFVPLACSRTSCETESMRGGLGWHTPTSSCTTGFSAIRGGVSGFVSAGHCAQVGADAFLGDENSRILYGSVLSSVETPTTDGLFVGRDLTYPGEARGWVFADDAAPTHLLTLRATSASYVPGRRSCFSARFSGVRCGRIVEGSYTDMLQGLRDVVVVDRGMCGVHGDSGSPVFDGPTAMGIFSGVLVDPLDPDEECTEAVFHKLAHVEADTGAYVILEPRRPAAAEPPAGHWLP